MKYSKWIGVITALALIVVCFIPWTYHADVARNFTGFFSEKNAYGKPGRFFIFFAATFIVLVLTPKVWAKRINLFLAAMMFAYAIKTYILYTSCYNAYCPEKKIGIYLVLLCNTIILITAVLPSMKMSDKSGE